MPIAHHPRSVTPQGTWPAADADEACASPCTDSERIAQGRAHLLDEEVYAALAETFRALADSTRAKIVYSLLKQELCTCDLAAILGTSDSAVSQHLRMLRQLRLVKSRRSGKLVFYSLDDMHIRILVAVCLGHVRDGAAPRDAGHAGLEKVLQLFEGGHDSGREGRER
jgi:DNA-binding transcriptional ArsR family regulator